MRERVSWATLKSFLDSRSLPAQYIEYSDEYKVVGVDSTFSIECVLDKGASDTSDLTDFETNYKPSANIRIEAELPPFGSKVLPNGKHLFRRIHGLDLPLDGTLNAQKVTFSVPYNSAKITSTEIISAVEGDKIDFKVLDTPTGTVSTIPNYVLNQFGFGVYPSSGRYEQKSEYDADLFLDLQLEITLTPINTDIRTVYFNLVLHEVV